MNMKKNLRNLFFAMGISITVPSYASSQVVLVPFYDNTVNPKASVTEIANDYAQVAFSEINDIVVVENNNNSNANLAVKKLLCEEGAVKDAVTISDFKYLFDVPLGKITMKYKDDFVNSDLTKMIGQGYGADYYIQGTVDSVTGEEEEGEVPFLPFVVSKKSYVATVDSTIWIIRTNDGKILWRGSGQGISKNRLVGEGVVQAGSAVETQQIYVEATQKSVEAIVNKLKKDLQSNKVKF